MLYVVLFAVLSVINGAYSLDCRTVKGGQHFSSLIPFHGFKEDSVITVRVKFNENTAHYLFPPTESKGRLCSQSWNTVWGSTRCGYFNYQLWDSDRFAWRRAGSCLQYDAEGHVVGERSNCPEVNLIELAASAYDGGKKPFQNPGTLLKEFSTKLRVNIWYRLRLTFEEKQSIYELLDDADQTLEVQTIDHRSCTDFNHGMFQSLYFGGQCPAPQAVTVCYN